MKKFKLYWDKDKEQNWINEMVQEGWTLTKYFLGIYTFEECEPGEYIYQIDLMGSTKEEWNNFKEFVEDAGIEVVTQWYRWIFLRKKASDGEFEMYTDNESKACQYKRIRNFFAGAMGVEIICFFNSIVRVLDTGSAVYWGFTLLILLFAIILGNESWKCHKKVKSLG